MNIPKVKNIICRLTAAVHASNTNLLTMFPLTTYIDCLKNYPEIGRYAFESSEIKEYCNNIVKYSNEQTLELYHKLVLITLIVKAEDRLQAEPLPDDIKKLYVTNFERIIRNIESNAPGVYKYQNDRFCKDLAVCNLRLIPAGAQKIHLDGISRRFLTTGGIRQFFKGLIFIFFELGGFEPLYQMHTASGDPDLMAKFNPDGWDLFYRRVANLLKINANIKGLFGSSWFFDPRLVEISPRLKYLREIVVNNGGKLFYLGTSIQGTKDALLKSQTRRRLYQEGKYIPTDYLVIWARKKLIEWADKQENRVPS